MSSSTLFTQNIKFSSELSTDQSPLPGVGGVLSSNPTGVFEIVVPPQPPSFVDGLTLQTDIASAGGVKWAAQSGPFTVTGNVISPSVATNSNMLFCNPTTNTISNCVNSSIISCLNSTVSTFPQDTSPPTAVSIIASNACEIRENGPSTTGDLTESSIIASDGCFIEGDRSRNRLIAASTNCSVTTQPGFGSALPQVILGSTDCISNQDCLIACENVYAQPQNVYTQTTCIGCENIGSSGSPVNLGNRNTFINCLDITNGGGSTTDNLVKGRKIDTTGKLGCVIFADNNTNASFLSPSSFQNQFVSRFQNGYEFYSNPNLTSGSIMAAGGGWATISDEDTKENLERLDDAICLNLCEKLLSIDVCKYNYIGNPSEQICYGPTAQDWHSEFSGELIDVPRREEITSEDGQVSEEFVLDESGERIFDQVPAKDPRCIEMSDMLGILMATCKGLNTKINALIEADVEKDQQITALIEDANEKDQQINNLVEAINNLEVEPPEMYFTNNPLTQSFPPRSGSGLKVFEYVCQKSGKISLVSSTCFKKTSGNGGTIFVQLRLNNQLFSPSIQSGYEGEQSQYAPDVSGLTINWSGDVNNGDILTVYGLATSGTFSLEQSGQFSGAAGAQLSITIY